MSLASAPLWSAIDLDGFPDSGPKSEAFARSHFAAALGHSVPIFGATRELYLETLRFSAATSRKNLPAHFTTSCFLLHPEREAMLLLHHRKYDEWVHPGGHADDDWILLRSALRECAEETGAAAVAIIPSHEACEALPGHLDLGGKTLPRAALLPLFIQAFSVPDFPDLCSHTHFDHVFRFRAPAADFAIAPSESLGARWVDKGWFTEHVRSGDEVREGVSRLTSEVCLRAFLN